MHTVLCDANNATRCPVRRRAYIGRNHTMQLTVPLPLLQGARLRRCSLVAYTISPVLL